MFVMGNLIRAVAAVIDILLEVYIFIIIGAVLVSWVNPDPYNPIVRFLRQATDPVLNRIRRVLPGFLAGGSGIDFSPFVAMVLIYFIRIFAIDSLAQAASRLR
jgi:YggT family protein